jgi:hypothetical protein
MATDLSNLPKLSAFSLHVKLTVAPENVDACTSPDLKLQSHCFSNSSLVFKALKPAYDAVIAEPENVYFEVFQNPQSPGEIRFIEHWNASVEWFVTVSLSVNCLGRLWCGGEPWMWKCSVTLGGANELAGPSTERLLQAVCGSDGANVDQAKRA